MTREKARKERAAFERLYKTRLASHLEAKTALDGVQARRLGARARKAGIKPQTLSRIHDRALAELTHPDLDRPVLSRSAMARADAFLAEAAAPTAPPTGESGNSKSAQSTPEVKRLRQEQARGRALKFALTACERRHRALLERSERMEERLRHLSRRLLHAQEEERIRISRDLHDAIGQTLVGINVGLASLQQDATADSIAIASSIARTQALVESSMSTVHEFARELRPTVLDDLGLVPALRSHTKSFAQRTGLKVRFVSCPAAARLTPELRIALFRVAQEALTNVARHAHATKVSVVLRKMQAGLRMEIRDDGKSFDVGRVGRSKKNRHLGLLGMQERMDMVGGTFSIESAHGKGTIVKAQVPLAKVNDA